ncbi:hypothetical protein D3C74_322690 [compost metagenome]
MQINLHYSLLEGGNHEAYKQRTSTEFVNRLAQIGQKNGYEEVDRELELYERRNQIGDIDLVLKNNDDHFILIEAKNHALPLNVYFKGFEAVSTRLKYLQGDWEKKVNKRISQLSSKHTEYNIGPNFTYFLSDGWKPKTPP